MTTSAESWTTDTESNADHFSKVFSGVRKLSNYQLKLLWNYTSGTETKIDPLPIERLSPQEDWWASWSLHHWESLRPSNLGKPSCLFPIQTKMMCKFALTWVVPMRHFKGSKLPEEIQEMNRSTVFSKLDMTMGLHQTELEASREITTFSAG